MIYVKKIDIPDFRQDSWEDREYPVGILQQQKNIMRLVERLMKERMETCPSMNSDEIIDVIHNAPATIVKWKDGTKTVVQVQPGDKYDKEAGLAFAICKKVFGNKGNYNEVFKKWVD